MRAGLLNYPITIQEPVTVKDVYGANGINWKDVISTRAQVTYNTGNRQNQSNEIIHCYTVTFTIRLYHKVNELIGMAISTGFLVLTENYISNQ